jgi:anti-anti-sigma regulatory factor
MQLPAILGLDEAITFKTSLQEAIEQQTPLTLDASGVEKITTSFIQVLLAARQMAETRNVPFSLQEPSEYCLRALHDLGVADVLMTTLEPTALEPTA